MKRIALIQLVLALALFAIVAGGYALWYASVGSLSATSARLAEEIQGKSKDSARIHAATAALSSLEANEASVRAYLVRTSDIVPFLESIEQTGTELGATVDVVSVAAETAGRPHLALSLKVQGSFDAVMRTIGAIEYGPFDSTLTGLTFDTVETADGVAVWTAATSFSIGTQPPANR